MKGVFTKSDLEALVSAGRIRKGRSFKQEHIGPASIDMTIDLDHAYEVERIFRPRQQDGEKIADIIGQMGGVSLKNSRALNPKGEVMYPGRCYVAKASIEANFSPGIYGYVNPKSTTGRNFLLTQLLADGMGWFDSIDKRSEGYKGELWVAFTPLVYPVLLSEEVCYNQLRIFDADTRFSRLSLEQLLQTQDLLFRKSGVAYDQSELSLISDDGSVITTLFALGGEMVGYKAKKNAPPIDLTARNIDPSLYFEPVYAKYATDGDKKSGYIELEANTYYLLSTNEMLKVPEHLSAELRMLDPRLGLFFSHFAGFFDPGFFGTATLEVMAPFDQCLRHKDPVARFIFEELRGATTSYAEKGSYQGQIETQLPKQFAAWKK